MNELIAQLVKQLGIQENQAQGGAGLLFKMAKDKLGGDFSKVEGALPGVADLVKAAPSGGGGGVGGMLTGLASKLGGEKAGNLAALASKFAGLKLDPGMIAKFIPIIMGFVQSKGGKDVAALLGKALQK